MGCWLLRGQHYGAYINPKAEYSTLLEDACIHYTATWTLWAIDTVILQNSAYVLVPGHLGSFGKDSICETVQMYIYIQTHTHTCKYIHMYVYTYMCTYVQICVYHAQAPKYWSK